MSSIQCEPGDYLIVRETIFLGRDQLSPGNPRHFELHAGAVMVCRGVYYDAPRALSQTAQAYGIAPRVHAQLGDRRNAGLYVFECIDPNGNRRHFSWTTASPPIVEWWFEKISPIEALALAGEDNVLP